MITILPAQRADIVNLDSCCLYTNNREVANNNLHCVCIAKRESVHNDYSIKDVLSYVIDEIITKY